MNLLRKTRQLDPFATSRRALLKALGVSVAAAPFVPALDGWAATATKAPQRLVLLFSPHGVNPEKYWPSKGASGAETDFAFPAGDDAILKPLTPHKADMIVFDGLKRDTCCGGMDHERLLDSLYSGSKADGANHRNGTGITIDQMLVASWAPAKETTFPSLQFAVQNYFWGGGFDREGAADADMIYSGPGAKIPAEWDPYKMFQKLFGAGVGGDTNSADFAKLRAQKKSVLDFVSAELTSLQSQVMGKDDRGKVQYHLDAVRDVEKQLQAPMATCGAIEAPDGTIDSHQNDNHPMLIPIMNKLLVAAIRCDRTRIASMQYSRAFSELYFRWLPNFKADKFHHDISHMANDPRIGIIQQWYMARFAELLQGFKDVTEFGEPMLNNMLVVNAMEMHTPWNHDCANRQPNWIAGKLGGVIPRTGRLIDFKGANDHNQFLVTILHAFGQTQVDRVGNLGTLTGALPGVLG